MPKESQNKPVRLRLRTLQLRPRTMGASGIAFVALALLPSLIYASADLDEILYSVSNQNKILPSTKGRLTPLQLLKESVALKRESPPAYPGNQTYAKSEEKNVIIDTVLKTVFESVLKPIYLPYSENVNDECKTDVKDKNFYKNLKDGKFWALQMVDSWGKLPDGFLFGNLRSTGMYEECLNVWANYTTTTGIIGPTVVRNYTGRYCQIYYDLGPKNESQASARGGIPIEDPTSPLPFSYGTCIPSSCTSEDMWISVNETLASLGLLLAHVECYNVDDPAEDLTPGDQTMLSFIGILGVLVALSTIYDVTTLHLDRSHMRAGAWKIAIGFSIANNLQRIFTYKQPPGSTMISCLPALRVVTMLWIIVSLQYEVGTDYLTNTVDSLRYQDPLIAQVVTNAWLAVDTFLFLTGLVITYRLLPYVVPAGSVQVGQTLGLYAKNFVRRFFRLSPTILFVSLFSATLLRFFAYGPRADILTSFSRDRCGPHWWKDPLFVNNYILGHNEGHDVNDCLDHCWYTAVDMQLLLILPLLLLPLNLHRVAGLCWLGLVSLGSILTPMSIILAHDLPPVPLHFMSESVKFEYMWRVYLTPWCRAGPWLAGVWTALALYDRQVCKVRIPKLAVFFGYIAAISLGLVLVLGLFPYNHVLPDKSYIDNPAMSAAYGSLARPVWGLCVAWVVFTCHTGNAGVVNKILSYPGWRPLARLTFPMYLAVPLVQLWWSSVQFQPTYYNYLEKLFQSAGVAFIAGVLAILLSCLVELPIRSLLDVLIPSEAKKQEDRIRPQKRDPESGRFISTSMM
ncbi:nose resistant to fluoxetine protein 6-like [Penaeus japonicus]|uniref:nose resistant to fluoxetine protein 6-like n=1 Tax=Penaeus japonicus TaxID=27405 RepID=UPI001C715D45|nr:nose resistant to fluoxetine protein 6-like [Penaeus japonicus]